MFTARDGPAYSSVLPRCLIRRSGGRIGGTNHPPESWTFTSRCIEERIVRYLLLLPNSLIQVSTAQGRLRRPPHWLWAAFWKVANCCWLIQPPLWPCWTCWWSRRGLLCLADIYIHPYSQRTRTFFYIYWINNMRRWLIVASIQERETKDRNLTDFEMTRFWTH